LRKFGELGGKANEIREIAESARAGEAAGRGVFEMMGEVLGMAAGLCKTHQTTPRGVYENHLPTLIDLMKKGVPAPVDDTSKLMFYTDKLQ
jgi:hypothetical protein